MNKCIVVYCYLKMDKRLPLLKALYETHLKLLDVFHSPPSDNEVLKEFCCLFIDFVDVLRPSSQRQFDYMFSIKNSITNKQVLKAHMYTARDYADTIVKRIAENPSLVLSNELIGVVFDYAKLLNAVEIVYHLPFGKFTGNRNMKINSYTAFKAATQIYWAPNNLERSNTLNGYAIFALRQALELAAKEMLGLDSLLDKNGLPFTKLTKLPWAFLVENKDKPFFNFCFNPADMQRIFTWANYFVHTGNQALCYVLGLALSTVKSLYLTKSVIDPFGNKDFQYVNEIIGYNAVKQKFEQYLSVRKEPLTAKWSSSPTLSFVATY